MMRASKNFLQIPVFCYHRVLPEQVEEPLATCHRKRGIVVDLVTFEHQIRSLVKLYKPLSLNHYIAGILSSKEVPPNACLVTFDDGYYDFSEYAIPILKLYKVPSTLFATVNQSEPPQQLSPVDRWYSIVESWWNQSNHCSNSQQKFAQLVHGKAKKEYICSSPSKMQNCLDKLRHHLDLQYYEEASPNQLYLDRKTLCQLIKENVTIGSHSWDHFLLTTLKDNELSIHLNRSYEWLRKHFPEIEPVLSYPNGANNQRIRQAAAKIGFRAALTVKSGLSNSQLDPMELPRFCIPNQSKAIEEVAKGKEISL